MDKKSCPCGRPNSYENCCKLIHYDIKNAKTAEDLMRSRYSAFVLANGDYLMESHHVSTRPIEEKEDIVKWAKSVEWIKLKVLNSTKGNEKDIEGSVEFKAFYKQDLFNQSIHENSKFVQEDGVWYYLGFVD